MAFISGRKKKKKRGHTTAERALNTKNEVDTRRISTTSEERADNNGEEPTLEESFPDSASLRLPDEQSGSIEHSLGSLDASTIARSSVSRMEWVDSLTGISAVYSGGVNEANEPHGYGVSQMENGHIITGHWKNGNVSGTGTYKWPSGTRYDGDFVNNLFHGSGIYRWSDGERYIGNFENGKQHGHGQCTSSDGTTYCGTYRYGRKCGKGSLVAEDGTVIYEGEWRDGQPVNHQNEDDVAIAAIEAAAGCSLTGRIERGEEGRVIELDLSWCLELTEIPPEIGILSKLETLNLAGCVQLFTLPAEVGHLVNLTKLVLNGCEHLKHLPKEIKKLTRLNELRLSNCREISYLPQEICKLEELTVLGLGGCSSLKELPSQLGHLTKLMMLTLGGCTRLKTLPPTVQQLAQRNNINLPMNLMIDSLFLIDSPATKPSDAFETRATWSGPGGLNQTEKKMHDENLVHLAESRMKPTTRGGVIEVSDYKDARSKAPTRAIPSPGDIYERLSKAGHQERWGRQLDAILDAHVLQQHSKVEQKVTELLNDTSTTLKCMECHLTGYFPISNTLAFYCRSLARAKSANLRGAVSDATECIKLIQTEKKCPYTKQRHIVRPDIKITMLRTRAICLEKLGDLDSAIGDRRACCAVIRILGNCWDGEPSLEDAVKELLHTMAIRKVQTKKSRPHYSIAKQDSIEEELGLRLYEKARFKCLECGAEPSDIIKLFRCGGCREQWLCSKECLKRAWRSGHKLGCADVEQRTRPISLPDSKREFVKEQTQQKQCIVEVLDGTMISILRDSRSGAFYDSLSDKNLSFEASTTSSGESVAKLRDTGLQQSQTSNEDKSMRVSAQSVSSRHSFATHVSNNYMVSNRQDVSSSQSKASEEDASTSTSRGGSTFNTYTISHSST